MHSQALKGLLTATAMAIALPSIASAQVVETNEIISLSDWRYDDLYAGGGSIEEMIDEMEVFGPTGEEIGSVENVLFSADGKVLSIIAEVGGFWDVGDTHVNIPWDRVELAAGGDGIVIPVTEETIEEYSLYPDEVVTAVEAAADVEAVDDDLETGPRVWRATELMDDYVRLREGTGYLNYGYVDDLIVRDGQLAGVVVRPDVGWGVAGARGPYAYPFYGYNYGWNPGRDYYDLPYGRDEIGDLEPFDYERFE